MIQGADGLAEVTAEGNRVLVARTQARTVYADGVELRGGAWLLAIHLPAGHPDRIERYTDLESARGRCLELAEYPQVVVSETDEDGYDGWLF